MTTAIGMLKIGDVSFPVVRGAFTSDGETLDLDVTCDYPLAIEEGHDWRTKTPRFYADGAAIPVNADLPVSPIATESGYSEDGESLFALYVHEHEPVTRCRGELRKEGSRYRLKLTGVGEVMGEPFDIVLDTVLDREPT